MACAVSRKGRRTRRILHAVVILALAYQQLGAVIIVGNGIATITPNDTEPDVPTAFALPMADTKTIDKLDDFDRYVDKKAWELAFRTMNAIQSDSKGMVPAARDAGVSKSKNFLFPSTLRMKQSLLHLPPEGRDAYRLFNDAAAKALWEKLGDPRSPTPAAPAIPNPSDETATLHKIVNQYFLTSIGDIAADRLADSLFEQGNLAAAASTWQSIVDDYPDTHLSTAKIQVKRCVALAALGRRDELAALVDTVKSQFSGQKVTIAGNEVDAADFVQTLSADPPPDTQPATQPTTLAAASSPINPDNPGILLATDQPAWQIRVTKSNAMAAMEQQIRNMGWGVDIHFVGAVPTAAVDDGKLFVNWMGVIYAADLQTGKILWRSSKFSDVIQRASMFAQYGVNPDHFSISAANGKVFALRVDTQRMQRNEGGAYILDAFDAVTGKSAWTAAGVGTAMTAPYIPSGSTTGYVAAIANDQNMTLVALNLQTGKSEWTLPLGKPQGSQNNWGGGQLYALPQMSGSNGILYIATNNGALIAVSTADRQVAWAFKNDTKPVQTDRMYYEPMPRAFETPATIREDAGLIFLKDTAAPTLYALDPNSPSLKWRRRISPEEMLIGVRGQVGYILGTDVSALDLKTQKLIWSTKIPVQTGLLTPLVEDHHIYVSTARGIYDIDPANGDLLHIFRGADKEASGGRLIVAHAGLTDELICVTDAAITAYPVERSTK